MPQKYWIINSNITTPKNHLFRPGDLDLWPWPLNSSEILSSSMSVKIFESICQTVRPWEHTGRFFYPRLLKREGMSNCNTWIHSNAFLGHFTPIAIPTSPKKILFTFTQISRLVLGVGKIWSLNILSPVKTWWAKKSVEEWKSDHLLP